MECDGKLFHALFRQQFQEAWLLWRLPWNGPADGGGGGTDSHKHLKRTYGCSYPAQISMKTGSFLLEFRPIKKKDLNNRI
jgi:hypothetical protein